VKRFLQSWTIEDAIILLGATLMNLALIYGAGLHWGWWGWSFWAGFGMILAVIRRPAK